MAPDGTSLGRRRLFGKAHRWVSSFCQWILDIVKRNDDVKGFKLLAMRWAVEGTFSWLSNGRRLSKHYEYWDETGEAMVHVAMIRLMLRRLTKETPGVGVAYISRARSETFGPTVEEDGLDSSRGQALERPCIADAEDLIPHFSPRRLGTGRGADRDRSPQRGLTATTKL